MNDIIGYIMLALTVNTLLTIMGWTMFLVVVLLWCVSIYALFLTHRR